MALSMSSIDMLRDSMERSEERLGNFAVKEKMDILRGNENYMAFVNGTGIGRELHDKLLKLEKIALTVQSDLTKIVYTTNKFLDEQKRLNSAIDYSKDPRFTTNGGGN